MSCNKPNFLPVVEAKEQFIVTNTVKNLECLLEFMFLCDVDKKKCTFPLRPYMYVRYSVDLDDIESLPESYGSKEFSYLL